MTTPVIYVKAIEKQAKLQSLQQAGWKLTREEQAVTRNGREYTQILLVGGYDRCTNCQASCYEVGKSAGYVVTAPLVAIASGVSTLFVGLSACFVGVVTTDNGLDSHTASFPQQGYSIKVERRPRTSRQIFDNNERAVEDACWICSKIEDVLSWNKRYYAYCSPFGDIESREKYLILYVEKIQEEPVRDLDLSSHDGERQPLLKAQKKPTSSQRLPGPGLISVPKPLPLSDIKNQIYVPIKTQKVKQSSLPVRPQGRSAIKSFACIEKSRDIPAEVSVAFPDAPSVKLAQELGLKIFGPEMWNMCVGSVKEIPLPFNIREILKSDCPFVSGKLICDTHSLILVPQHINGQKLSVASVGSALSNTPNKGVFKPLRHHYWNMQNIADGHQGAEFKKAITSAPKGSYWALVYNQAVDLGDCLERQGYTWATPYESMAAILSSGVARETDCLGAHCKISKSSFIRLDTSSIVHTSKAPEYKYEPSLEKGVQYQRLAVRKISSLAEESCVVS